MFQEWMMVDGEKLREEREKRGLYQREVAEMIGVNRATYRNWEQNKYKTSDKYKRKLYELFGECVFSGEKINKIGDKNQVYEDEEQFIVPSIEEYQRDVEILKTDELDPETEKALEEDYRKLEYASMLLKGVI